MFKFLLKIFGIEDVKDSGLQEFEDIRTQYSIKNTTESSNYEFVDLDKIKLDRDIATSIPDSLAKRYNAIPISIDGNLIKLAMAEPENILAIDDIRLVTGYDIEPLKAEKSAIKRAIDRFFRDIGEIDDSLEDHPDYEVEEIDIADTDDSPIARVFRLIIKQAIHDNASEIRIICDEKPNEFTVYYVVNGNMSEVMSPPNHIRNEMLAYIKMISNLDMIRNNIQQEGKITYEYDGTSYNILISIIPSSKVEQTENVIMKILK